MVASQFWVKADACSLSSDFFDDKWEGTYDGVSDISGAKVGEYMCALLCCLKWRDCHTTAG